MSKEIYISTTPHETRLAIVENDELTEIYYERENEYTLAGSIYNGRVTRVLPGMQSSFVDVGLERDAFLYITDFMEEAGDSADFDHGGQERSARAPRSEGQPSRSEGQHNGRDRNQEAERTPERNGGYVSERSQEQARATPQTDVARASEGRNEEFGGRGERNERGGRGRGRGRRERGSGSQPQDRTGSMQRPDEAESHAHFVTPDQDIAPPPLMEEVLDEPFSAGAESAPAPVVSQEIGEGAPGADGSRRWRGRRGRRRGRGAGTRDGAGVVAGESNAVEGAGEAAENSHAFDEEPVFEIDGSAAEAIAAPAVTPEPRVLPAQPRSEGSERVRRPAGEGRERGGREDRPQRSHLLQSNEPSQRDEPLQRTDVSQRSDGSQRNDVSQRNDRPQRNDRGGARDRGPRVPRGFAPNRFLYGVEAEATVAETAEVDAVIEPLILPGESLGKYRKGTDEAARPAEGSAGTTSAALPDNAFKVDASWDGGAMLPGETLSRYRGGASPAASRDVGGSEPRQSDGRREGRSGRGDQERNDQGRAGSGSGRQALTQAAQPAIASAAPMTVPATVPPADYQSAGPLSGYAHVDEKTEEIRAHRPEFQAAELPRATAEAPEPQSAGHAAIEQIDATHVAAEPEIEDKQALSEAGEEYEPHEASASYRVDPAALSEYRQSAPAVEELPESRIELSEAEGIVSPSDEPAHGAGTLESLHAGQALETAESVGQPTPFYSERAHEEGRAESHEVTTLDAAGTMFFEPELPVAEALHVEATGEIEVVEELHTIGDEEGDQGGVTPGFSPGAGDLEEDFIDDEELDTANLHAHGAEEFDDVEEEPLESGADLGTMIRDMSLDQMTRSGTAVEEDEEDFEEDTLEEEMASEEEDSLDDEEAEEEPGLDRFASAESGDGNQDGMMQPEARSEIASRSDGEANRTDSVGEGDSDRRGRRDGRRGGRGDRDRSRGGGSERSGSLERNAGVDRSGTPERSGANGSSGSNGSNGFSERSGYDRGGLGERARNTGGSGDRDRGRSGGRGGRQSMQMTNLPAISELLKPGQEILCQIAKEPIAKKGARITSHIALPGRFLVFMPTVSHTGVSRKIESDAERRRLKEILLSEKGEAAGGFIVRTAADGASEEELRSDLRFLLNLWTDIKARSESSKSPALIYHDLNLVERILRDQVTDNFSSIWVDTETEYERVLRFLQRFQPGLIRRVKLYTKETPLFEQFGITEEINKALRSKVWLKSGGSIVINQTEALVAIDINTGKYVGKTARLEDTIVKTNLDAIPEIVRQIRLRDLGGIIIIDFIDMDERKNRNRVMAALEEELKNDRAPSKVLPFNDFGLVAITRKRVKQSLERTLSTPCNVCVGTGMVKSPVTVCNDIYVEMRKMHKHLDRGDVMLRVHPEVVKQLKLTGSRWLQEMEEMCGRTILIKSDPALHPEQFDIH